MWLPKKVVALHCPSQRGESLEARGNHALDLAAKQAAHLDTLKFEKVLMAPYLKSPTYSEAELK